MREKKTGVNTQSKRRGRVWLWLFIVILVICGAATWVL